MTSKSWCLRMDKETGIPIVKIVDDMTLEEFGEFLTIISDAPTHQGSERCLWDLRSVSNLLSSMAIRYFGVSTERARGPKKTAIVVERDVHFGLAQMFAICTNQPGTTRRVFRDYEQARGWLMSTDPPTRQVPARYLSA